MNFFLLATFSCVISIIYGAPTTTSNPTEEITAEKSDEKISRIEEQLVAGGCGEFSCIEHEFGFIVCHNFDAGLSLEDFDHLEATTVENAAEEVPFEGKSVETTEQTPSSD